MMVDFWKCGRARGWVMAGDEGKPTHDSVLVPQFFTAIKFVLLNHRLKVWASLRGQRGGSHEICYDFHIVT